MTSDAGGMEISSHTIDFSTNFAAEKKVCCYVTASYFIHKPFRMNYRVMNYRVIVRIMSNHCTLALPLISGNDLIGNNKLAGPQESLNYFVPGQSTSP